MNYKTTVDFDLKLEPFAKELGGDAFGHFMSQSVHKNYYDAMPFNTGAFASNIDFSVPWEYTHEEPYSVYVYNLNMNFRKSPHAAATAFYIDNYESVARPKIEKDAANYTKTRIFI